MNTTSNKILKEVNEIFEGIETLKKENANDEKYNKIKYQKLQEINYKTNFIFLIILSCFGFVLLNLEELNSFMTIILYIGISLNIINSIFEKLKSLIIDCTILFLPLLCILISDILYSKNIIPDLRMYTDISVLFYIKLVFSCYLLIPLTNIILKFLYNLKLSKEDKNVIKKWQGNRESIKRLNNEFTEIFKLALKDNDVMNELLTNTKYKDLLKNRDFFIEKRVEEIEEEKKELKKQKRRLEAFSKEDLNTETVKLEKEISIKNY